MEEWKTYRFSELYAQPSRNGLTKPKSVRGKGYKMVNMGELFKYPFIGSQIMDRVQLSPSEISNSLLEFGDILFARQSLVESGVGKCSLVNKLNEPTTFESHIIRVRPNTFLANPAYLYYLFNSPNIRQRLVSMANGVAAFGIKGSDLSAIELTLPPVNEQQAIASILSALDDKIELNLQMNKTLEELAMALYKHWFVDFGPFQNGKFVESELGMIPEGWEMKSIGDIVKINGGYAFKSKDFSTEGEKVIKIKNITNNVVSIQGSDCIPFNVAEKTNEKFSVKPGAYLVAMTGAEVGKVGIVPDYNERLWLNQRVGMIGEPKFESADILVGIYLQSEECYEIIQNLAYGSAQPNISSSGLEGISMNLPKDITTIKLVLENLKNWDELKVINHTENQSLKSLRDTLLPKLISGQIRVKDAEQMLAASL